MDRLIYYFTTIFNSLQVVIGLSVVILLHELGHFLLAKWNGVKVERFSLGFPPNILSFRKGETEYVLGAVPLGGYVSLYGEGLEEDGSKTTDPRAFRNKSVAARMAIMSAGVVMNLFLGLGCFIYAYGNGIEERKATIGDVVPGSPAYFADLRAGDEIVSIDGRDQINFDVVLNKIRLSWSPRNFRLELKRAGHEGLIPLDVHTKREGKYDSPTVGIYQQEGLNLAPGPYRIPAGRIDPPVKDAPGFQFDDEIVAAGPEGEEPTPVHDSRALRRLMLRQGDKTVNVVVKRSVKVEGTKSTEGTKVEQVTVPLPPNHVLDFGFRLEIEPVSAIRVGSIAEKAGFRVGDLIEKVDGDENFDPMYLPYLCYQHSGKPITFTVSRKEAGKAVKEVELTATPDDTLPWCSANYAETAPEDVPGLGLAYPVRTKIIGIEPGSPAEKAGLKVGDVINALTIPLEKADNAKSQATPIKFDEDKMRWPYAFRNIQDVPKRAFLLTVNNSNKPISITPEPVPTWFNPERGESLQVLMFKLPPMGPVDAIRHGFYDTLDNILNIYATLRGLVTRRIPFSGLAGPITIFRVAYSAADTGLPVLIRFLGILSINLAVLNFLPIPPLDGGQMVYLLAEGVRGRPIPERAKNTTFWMGVILVLVLMACVLVQDVMRW